MSDKNAKNEDAQQDDTQIRMRVLAQFIRDLSFENILVQKRIETEIEPTLEINVNLDARRVNDDHHYEVLMKLNINSKDSNSGKPLFLMELDYAGVFEILGVPEDQMHPFLLIECPRMLFPFARRIVSDLTRDGGFPPVNLENIDFVQLYRNELIRRQQMQQDAGEKADQPVN